MKLLFYYVGTGDVHKLYTYCFANTIIRVHTDHYFIGLNNCLLAIAAASPSSPPPPPSRFPSFSFFSGLPLSLLLLLLLPFLPTMNVFQILFHLGLT